MRLISCEPQFDADVIRIVNCRAAFVFIICIINRLCTNQSLRQLKRILVQVHVQYTRTSSRYKYLVTKLVHKFLECVRHLLCTSTLLYPVSRSSVYTQCTHSVSHTGRVQRAEKRQKARAVEWSGKEVRLNGMYGWRTKFC